MTGDKFKHHGKYLMSLWTSDLVNNSYLTPYTNDKKLVLRGPREDIKI